MPYELVLTEPSYYAAVLQDLKISRDVDLGDINIVSTTVASALLSDLETLGGISRDPTLGLAALLVTALPPCATTGGATVSITPSGPNTRAVYVADNGTPSANTTTSAEALPVHVIFYNVPVGSVIASIDSPGCKQLPWPVMAMEVTPGSGAYTDTGNAQVEAGDSVSYLHVYLGD
jgi:hypothetical protein